MNSSKQKGDKAELEVQAILRDELGQPARRALGAGRKDDVGDIHGVPDTVIQVVNAPSKTLRMVREKPLEAERQKRNVLGSSAAFAATFVRLAKPRGKPVEETAYPHYRVVLTVEQWCAMWREAQ